MTNTQTCKFPIELLDASAEKRIDHFLRSKIEHANLKRSFDQAMAAINSACSPKVVIVTGPTGVGKTTLARWIYKTLVHQYHDLIEQDPGTVPVTGFNAIPPNGNSFNWKDFYIRLLERHGDVLLDRKMLMPRQHDLFEGMTAPLPIERSTTEALRRAAERCMKFRKTKVLIIDEAHHILMVNDPKRLEFQFEALKSLTIESEVVIVLVGTYRLLNIRDQSGQLVRRSEIIHFPRYNLVSNEDSKDFIDALRKLQEQLPLPVPPMLTANARHFFNKSGGSIGILKDWLSKCLENAILLDMKTFDAEFANKYAPTNKSLITILDEAIEGELRLEDASLEEVQKLLYRVAGKALVSQASPKNQSKKQTEQKHVKKVGERKPARDKTGVDHEKH